MTVTSPTHRQSKLTEDRPRDSTPKVQSQSANDYIMRYPTDNFSPHKPPSQRTAANHNIEPINGGMNIDVSNFITDPSDRDTSKIKKKK